MKTLDEFIDHVADGINAEECVSIFLTGLKSHIADAMGPTPEVQARLDAMFAALEARKDELAVAIGG